jgi:hypothetical protein
MLDPSVFDAVRLPSSALLALDSRAVHAVVQPWHYLLRAVHILSAGAFFGGIVLLDLRLVGVRSAAELKAFSADVMPWLYIMSGVLLFLYDLVLVASRSYFVPKIIFIILALVNAALYHRVAYEHALTAQAGTPLSAKFAGALSIVFWVGVMAFSAITESCPMSRVSRLGTMYYFFHFLVILPLVGWLERPNPLPISISTPALMHADPDASGLPRSPV